VAADEQLAQPFRRFAKSLRTKDRNTDSLKTWLAVSSASEIPELKTFAAGLQRCNGTMTRLQRQLDIPGATAKSRGGAEVHRLKLLKRQAANVQRYGRGVAADFCFRYPQTHEDSRILRFFRLVDWCWSVGAAGDLGATVRRRRLVLAQSRRYPADYSRCSI
jgi:hypothetical protein